MKQYATNAQAHHAMARVRELIVFLDVPDEAREAGRIIFLKIGTAQSEYAHERSTDANRSD